MERPNGDISAATVERASAYRWWLSHLLREGRRRIYSHELAAMEQVTPAQVRRDLMKIGYTGSPAHGYDIGGLVCRIGELLDPPPNEGVALVGVGHLGRVLLSYLVARHPPVQFVGAFDVDPEKVARVIHGVPCFHVGELESIARERAVRVGVVTVPAAAAQDVAARLVAGGVGGILNFAPVRLRVPTGVFVENVDIAALLEKTAFFARRMRAAAEVRM